jgi:hypothetical protein
LLQIPVGQFTFTHWPFALFKYTALQKCGYSCLSRKARLQKRPLFPEHWLHRSLVFFGYPKAEAYETCLANIPDLKQAIGWALKHSHKKKTPWPQSASDYTDRTAAAGQRR